MIYFNFEICSPNIIHEIRVTRYLFTSSCMNIIVYFQLQLQFCYYEIERISSFKVSSRSNLKKFWILLIGEPI